MNRKSSSVRPAGRISPQKHGKIGLKTPTPIAVAPYDPDFSSSPSSPVMPIMLESSSGNAKSTSYARSASINVNSPDVVQSESQSIMFGEIPPTDPEIYSYIRPLSFIKSFPGNHPLLLIASILLIFVAGCGFGWYYLIRLSIDNDDEITIFGQEDWFDSIWLASSVIISGYYDETIPQYNGIRGVYLGMTVIGMIIFCFCIGIISFKTSSYLRRHEQRRIAEETHIHNEHTIILGWNQATLPLLVELCTLRNTFGKKKLGWGVNTNTLTPLASSKPGNRIILVNNQLSEDEMYHLIEISLIESGLYNQRGAVIKDDIVVLHADPSRIHSMLLCGARRASSVLIMMNERDSLEMALSNSSCENGATTKTILSLRHILFTHVYDLAESAKKKHIGGAGTLNPKLRIVAQLSQPSSSIDAASFTDINGENIVHLLYANDYLSNLDLLSIRMPRLTQVLGTLLSFDTKDAYATETIKYQTPIIRHCTAIDLKPFMQAKTPSTFSNLKKYYSNAVFIGVVTSGSLAGRGKGYGLCPNPDTVIQPTDEIVYICSDEKLQFTNDLYSKYTDYDNQGILLRKTVQFDNTLYAAHEHKSGAISSTPSPASSSSIQQSQVKHILICGWRSEWQYSSMTFKNYLMEIADELLPGSTITFLNTNSTHDFVGIMNDLGMKIIPSKDGESFFGVPLIDLSYHSGGYSGGRGWGKKGSQFSPTTPMNSNFFFDSSSLLDAGFVSTLSQDRQAQFKNAQVQLQAQLHSSSKNENQMTYFKFKEQTLQGVVIRHTSGSAESAESLEPLILINQAYNIIVIVADKCENKTIHEDIVRESMDIRTLNSTLLLRKLLSIRLSLLPGFSQIKPMMGTTTGTDDTRLVVEIQEKASSRIILAPLGNVSDHAVANQPDFINRTELQAKALAITLAYPILCSAISDLFSMHSGNAHIEIHRASVYIPLNCPMEFGVVCACVAMAENEISIAIGYIEKSHVHLSPAPSVMKTFYSNDKLIIIRKSFHSPKERNNKRVDLSSTMRGSQSFSLY